MFKRVLVPLDGSELAEYAIAHAFTIARQVEQCKVTLFRVPLLNDIVIPNDLGVGVLWPEDSFESSINEANVYLQDAADRYADPDVPVETMTGTGDEASAVIDVAVEHDVDLIDMSPHGRSGLSRWLLGSVTERVLEQAPCPVLVVRSEKPIRNVMITLDGSQLAEQALESGLAMSELFGGRCTLLTVDQPATMNRVDAELSYQLSHVERGLGDQVWQSLRNRGEAYLEQLSLRNAKVKAALLEGMERVVLTGPVAENILAYAEKNGVDMIVMATHGRSGIQRWVYGSVTSKVLRQATCAMLVVRPTLA